MRSNFYGNIPCETKIQRVCSLSYKKLYQVHKRMFLSHKVLVRQKHTFMYLVRPEVYDYVPCVTKNMFMYSLSPKINELLRPKFYDYEPCETKHIRLCSSHGIKKNENCKRKSRVQKLANFTLRDLAAKLDVYGRHCMFSYLSSLPIGGGRVVRWCWVNFQCWGVLQFGLE